MMNCVICGLPANQDVHGECFEKWPPRQQRPTSLTLTPAEIEAMATKPADDAFWRAAFMLHAEKLSALSRDSDLASNAADFADAAVAEAKKRGRLG